MPENPTQPSTKARDLENERIEGDSIGSGKTLVSGTLLKMVLVIFVVEAWLMLLIHHYLPNQTGLNLALMGASTLAIGTTPLLFFWVVSPLRRQLHDTLVSLERAKREAEQLALRDSLTKLLNRRALFEIFDQEWSRSERTHSSLSCIMLDIDYFKEINDTLGHLAGDNVLSQVSGILEQQCRKCDTVGRYGGEEFCAVLPDTNKEQAFKIAERIRNAIRHMNIRQDDKKVPITVSIGVAERDDETLVTQELIDKADQALLLAKKSGRNCTVRSNVLTEKSIPAGDEELVGLK